VMLGYHANWKFMGSPDKVSTVALQRHFSILLDQKAKFFCASKISSNLRLFIAPVSQNANMQIDRSHSAEKGLRTQLESSLQKRSSLISWYLLTEASQCPNFCPRSCCVCDRAEIWDQPSIWVLALCYFAGRSPNLPLRGLLLGGEVFVPSSRSWSLSQKIGFVEKFTTSTLVWRLAFFDLLLQRRGVFIPSNEDNTCVSSCGFIADVYRVHTLQVLDFHYSPMIPYSRDRLWLSKVIPGTPLW